MANEKQLIILIGAARSGTKAFRSLFNTHPEISVIPYDINYIWQIGNEKASHDLFAPGSIGDKSRKTIKEFVSKYYNGNDILVEKTVSNTIRIPFILSIYPEAKFIFLYRQGVDVVESVHRQWGQNMDKGYLFEKLKHVPIKQLFTYGIKYLKRNLQKSSDYYWGVKTPAVLSQLNTYTKLEAIAYQWKFCVEKMLDDRSFIKEDCVVDVFYEDFVTDPAQTMKEIVLKFDLKIDPNQFNTDIIKTSNVGKSKRNLSESEFSKIETIIASSQERITKLKESL